MRSGLLVALAAAATGTTASSGVGDYVARILNRDASPDSTVSAIIASTATYANTSSGSILTAPPTIRPTSAPKSTAGSFGWQTTGTNVTIPDMLSSECAFHGSPCEVYCPADDTSCIQVANSVAASCSPQWTSYFDASSTYASLYFNSTFTWIQAQTEVETYLMYPTTSTATEAITVYGGVLMTPVYVFGEPSTVIDTTAITYTWTDDFQHYDIATTFTETVSTYQTTYTSVGIGYVPFTSGEFPTPTPYCSVTSATTQTCGQCTITGGSVQLFYWPETAPGNASAPMTAAPSNGVSASANGTTAAPAVATVNGTLFFTSPTVYISLETAYASKSCHGVGSNYSGSILAMNPKSVSSVYGVGEGYDVPAGAKPLNYADLQGIVPVNVYEDQLRCARFGCPTIYDDYRPTLAVPPQIRSLDPAWAGCVLNINGLYDPPQALSAENSVAAPTVSWSSATTTTPAAPGTTITSPGAASTSVPVAVPDTISTSSLAPSLSSSIGKGSNTVSAATPHTELTQTALSGSWDTSIFAYPVTASTQTSLDGPTPTSSTGDTTHYSAHTESTQTSLNGPQPADTGTALEDVTTSGSQPEGTEVDQPGPSSSSVNAGGVIASLLASSSDPVTQATSTDPAGVFASLLGTTAPADLSAGFSDPTAAPVILVGGSTVTANSAGQYSVGPGATLAPGGGVVIVSGTTYSIAASGSAVVANGVTQQADPASTIPFVVVAGSTIPQNSAGQYVVGSSATIAAGNSAIVIEGTTYSVATSGSALVVNGVTELPASLSAVWAPDFVVAGSTLTPNSAGQYIVNSQTLAAGSSSVVVDGTTYSVATSGSAIVVNGVTESPKSIVATGTPGTGSVTSGAPSASASDATVSSAAPGQAASQTSSLGVHSNGVDLALVVLVGVISVFAFVS